jgi:phage baseplate assembly protein W
MTLAAIKVPSIVVYSDVNPDVLNDGPFELVFNADSIRKSLDTIFTTPYSSRVFRRGFGTKLFDLLFEPVDGDTALKVENLIRDMASAWEPRIDNMKLLVIPDPQNQQYYVDMKYSIIGLGDKMVSYKFNISK